jgi:hypothetical protein
LKFLSEFFSNQVNQIFNRRFSGSINLLKIIKMFAAESSNGNGRSLYGKKESYSVGQDHECIKLRPHKGPVDLKKAVAYLKLRADGCPQKESMSFCCRRVCKSDSTKTTDGPTNFRTLKVTPNPHASMVKGWTSGLPNYSMGKKYVSSVTQILNNDTKTEGVNTKQEKLRDGENIHTFNNRIKKLTTYYQDFADKTKFRVRGKNVMLDKIKDFRKNLQEVAQTLFENEEERDGFVNLAIKRASVKSKMMGSERMIFDDTMLRHEENGNIIAAEIESKENADFGNLNNDEIKLQMIEESYAEKSEMDSQKNFKDGKSNIEKSVDFKSMGNIDTAWKRNQTLGSIASPSKIALISSQKKV